MSLVTRFRERLVLGHVRRSFDDGERILAWAHARVPGVRQPGVLVVTERRGLMHVASAQVEDRTSLWGRLESWRLDHPARSKARLTLVGDDGESVGELSLSSRGRARSASRVVEAIADRVEVPLEVTSPAHHHPVLGHRLVPQLHAARRGLRDHARRVVITVVGVLVLLLSLVFASPFVPGPGSLTAVAGIAILAREYEWARDLHVWASRQLERFVAWLRRRRDRARQSGGDGTDDPAPDSQVREAA
jgi:uncharacterized protein (TIGR02611 family)